VRNFNPESLKSYDLRDCVYRCVELISGSYMVNHPESIRTKTEEYLWTYYNPYLDEYPLPDGSKDPNDDMFVFQIKMGEKLIIESGFRGNHIPPRIRYNIDIRGVIKDILREIRNTLSSPAVTMVK